MIDEIINQKTSSLNNFTFSLLIVSEFDFIKDFMWSNKKMNVLRNIFDCSLFDNIDLDSVLIQFIKYIADLHNM